MCSDRSTVTSSDGSFAYIENRARIRLLPQHKTIDGGLTC